MRSQKRIVKLDSGQRWGETRNELMEMAALASSFEKPALLALHASDLRSFLSTCLSHGYDTAGVHLRYQHKEPR